MITNGKVWEHPDIKGVMLEGWLVIGEKLPSPDPERRRFPHPWFERVNSVTWKNLHAHRPNYRDEFDPRLKNDLTPGRRRRTLGP